MTPLGVDPAFGPGDDGHGDFLLFVGAVQERKDPLAALAAARAAACRSSSSGPRRSPRLVAELQPARRGRARGSSRRRSSPSSIAVRRRSSCPRATRASACRCSRRWRAARRSSLSGDVALREVAGDAARLRRATATRGAIERALADRERLVARRARRARRSSRGGETARADGGRVSAGARDEGRSRRRLARACRANSPSRCRRSARRSTSSS